MPVHCSTYIGGWRQNISLCLNNMYDSAPFNAFTELFSTYMWIVHTRAHHSDG